MARLREAIPGMHGLWSGRPVRPRPLTTSRRFQRSAAVAPCGTSNTLKIPTGNTNERTLMSAPPAVISDANMVWELPSRGRVGMYCLISAEWAIFTILVVSYLFYFGRSLLRSMPDDVLYEW